MIWLLTSVFSLVGGGVGTGFSVPLPTTDSIWFAMRIPINEFRNLGTGTLRFGVNTAELSGPSRRQQICQARALIGYLAVRELRISGADVARLMNIDRSYVSRAVGRVQADPALKNLRKVLLDHLYPQG